MAQPELTPRLALLEEAVTILFCQVDDIYYRLNPQGRRYENLKELSDSEVVTLALFQQLRGVESERSFLREVARFFSHLFSRGSWVFIRLRSIVAFVDSGDSSNP
jgi:hypothetical protein